MITNKSSINEFSFLDNGGKMGEFIRLFPWANTPLGEPKNWPAALKLAIGIQLRSPFPMHIAWGKDYLQFYNDSYSNIFWETDKTAALGLSIVKSYPLEFDTINQVFSEVMKGNPVKLKKSQLFLEQNGLAHERYFDFYLSPILDDDGSIGGVLINVVETTEMVSALAQLEMLQLDLKNIQTKKLQQRDALTQFLMQSPAGVCILGGKEFIFEMLNPFYQQLFPGRDLLGKPVLKAIPELADDPIIDILAGVLQLGKTFKAVNRLIPMARTPDGPIEERYFDLTYQARLDENGIPNGILVYVIEVTEKRNKEMLAQSFMDVVSNEVRTPINAMGTILKMTGSYLQKADADQDLLRTMMDQADGELKELKHMIDIYLNLSQFKSGKIYLSYTSFDLSELITNILVKVRVGATRHQFAFNNQRPFILSADKIKIGLVIQNLLNSAVKYSPAGGDVTIGCKEEDSYLQVSVTDTGLGIRAKDLEKIFAFLNEEIIETHGGKIWTEKTPTLDTSFHFSLPLQRPLN